LFYQFKDHDDTQIFPPHFKNLTHF
jgi:hypothetical protein